MPSRENPLLFATLEIPNTIEVNTRGTIIIFKSLIKISPIGINLIAPEG